MKILRSHFQLLGVTALFIACKYEEVKTHHIAEFVDYCAQTYTKEEIIRMESLILQQVQFELNIPFSNYFYEVLSLLFRFNPIEKKFGYFLLEAFLLNDECNKFTQSEIAKGVCFILLNKNWTWGSDSPIIRKIYGINKEEMDIIISCSKELNAMIENSDQIKKFCKAVYIKYGY